MDIRKLKVSIPSFDKASAYASPTFKMESFIVDGCFDYMGNDFDDLDGMGITSLIMSQFRSICVGKVYTLCRVDTKILNYLLRYVAGRNVKHVDTVGETSNDTRSFHYASGGGMMHCNYMFNGRGWNRIYTHYIGTNYIKFINSYCEELGELENLIIGVYEE